MTVVTNAPSAGAGTRPVRRLRWRLAPAPPADRVDVAGRRVTVIGGTSAMADGVRAELTSRGALLLPEPESRDGAESVPDTVVDLTLAAPFAPLDAAQWRAPLLRTFDLLRRCYARWSEERAVGKLTYLAVTYLGGGMGYHPEDDVAQPLGGLWAGLAKTLHRELPNCAARVVDIGLDQTGNLPRLVADELCLTGLSEIGHRDGRRWTLTPEATAPGPARVGFDSSDTALISGGGRGIGMALAKRLAAVFGMRVIVTGRSSLPPEEEWSGLTAEALRERREALWAQRRSGRPVVEIRRDIADAERVWELTGNLSSARAAGLRVDYLPCDFTDARQVAALVEGLPALTAVVHNAGVDRPARLPRKTEADIVTVVSTKVDAFVNLLDAVRDRDLKLFCTVGSLTGRLGGMVGQFDYAAANECLARLGMWAEHRVPFPVMTMAWPTWARMGLIANFEASLRYMAAMDVSEGLDHWRAELEAGTRGEVSFAAPLGQALDPAQAVSYPLVPCVPGFDETYPKVFHLGTPETYRAHDALTATVEFDAATTPAVGDFTVHGLPAVPVGLLVENAARAAEWLVPEHLPRLHLLAVERLLVPWSLLICRTADRVRLHRSAQGTSRDGRWIVDVVFRSDEDERHAAPADAEARLSLVFGEEPPAAGPAELPPVERAASTTLLTDTALLAWRGLTIPVASWRDEGDGRIAAEVPRCRPSDVWAVPHPPSCTVPVAAIENVVRAMTLRTPGLSATPDPLVVPRIAVRGPEPERLRVVGDPAFGVWRVADADSSAPVAVLHSPPGRPARTGLTPETGRRSS